MADALAVLGLEVDASGAFRAVEKLDTELKELGTTAAATSGAVARVGPASNASAAGMRASSDAAARAAANIGAVQQTAARASLATAGFSTALAALGGPTGVAAIAAMQALDVVLQVVASRSQAAAEKAKAQAKALDEATDAARKYREEEANGVAADTVKNLRAKAAEIDSLTKAIENANRVARLSQSGAIGSGTGVVAGRGADAALLAQREKALEDQRTLQRQFNALQLEAEQNAEDAKTRERNALLKGDRAIAADRAAAIEKLRFDQARLQQLQVAAAGGADNLGERAKLAESIASTRAALDAAGVAADKSAGKLESAADKVLKAEQQYFATLAKVVADSDAAVERVQAGYTRERLAGLDASEKQRKELADIAALRDRANKNAAETISQLEFQVSLIGKTKQEQEGLIDLENARVFGLQTTNAELISQYVELQRQLRESAESTETWAETLTTVLGIVQLVGGAWGDIGNQIAKAATGAQSLIGGLERASKLKDTSSFTATAGAAGAIVGGASVLLEALTSLDQSQRKNAERAAELTKQFEKQMEAANNLGGSLAGATAQIERTTEELRASATAVLEANIRAARGNRDAIRTALSGFEEAMESIAAIAKRNAEDLARYKRDLATFTGNNDVLRLRQNGQDGEADILQTQIDINAKVAEAAERFGNTIEGAAAVAEYRLLLMAQAALDAAEAEEERQREAARVAEEQRRRVFDLNNGTRAFTDPRGAGLAALDENAARRYNDAATAAEKLAVEAYNAAERLDYLAQQAEQDTRTTESLIARILSASGDARGAEDASFAASQRQEMAEAIRSGMSESNLALLRFTQFAERSQLQMQRAIEDGTKAILDQAKLQIAAIDDMIEAIQSVSAREIKALDDQIEATQTAAKATAKAFDLQISAIREQTKAQIAAIDAQIDSARDALDAAQKQLSVLEKSVQTNRQVVDALRQFRDSLKLGGLSTLSPQDKLAEARAQFERTSAAAQGGDSAAALRLPAAAQALLEASRAFNASGPGFVTDYNRVQAVVDAVERQFGATLPVQEQQLEAARQAVESLQQSLEALQEQKQAIQDSAESQIAAIQEAKDKAAEDAQKTIDRLTEQRDLIRDNAQKQIDKLNETKDAINLAAQKQIDELVKIETAAHLTRLRQDEYWTTFLGLTNPNGGSGGDSRDRLRTGPRTAATSRPVQVAEDQLAEARSMRQELLTLRTEVAHLREENRAGNDIAVAASGEEVRALHSVIDELRALVTETRNTGQALVVRR